MSKSVTFKRQSIKTKLNKFAAYRRPHLQPQPLLMSIAEAEQMRPASICQTDKILQSRTQALHQLQYKHSFMTQVAALLAVYALLTTLLIIAFVGGLL